MKKGIKIGLIVLAVLVIVGLISSYFIRSYNHIVAQNEAVSGQWANVENQYQRRADLIPNLVNTVKGYATHEQQTLTEVIEARAKATQTQITFDELNEETLAQYNQAQGELSAALGRLMVVSEAYPALQANQNFRDLQTQLEGTENRIATERRRFNEMVQSYNVYVQQFPRNVIAGMFGFKPKSFFAAEPGAEKAPKVEF
ncbi:MAG TPA: LemA family protein [Candidatus Rikenella faecigallinarum]|uniref:LemA family protein n=1 Tax=Candidatus Rikenella faecigallinarum TaxID=2838745 RepID=A0A9D1QD70_9BACT|nr:LemA family protein [Candidatus Rikenella faecigallinarum]